MASIKSKADASAKLKGLQDEEKELVAAIANLKNIKNKLKVSCCKACSCIQLFWMCALPDAEYCTEGLETCLFKYCIVQCLILPENFVATGLVALTE